MYFCIIGKFRDIGIGKAHPLCLIEEILIQDDSFQFLFIIHNPLNGIQEKHINPGSEIDSLLIGAKPEEFGNGINPVICSLFNIGEELFHCFFLSLFSGFVRKIFYVELFQMNMVLSVLKRPDRLQQAFFHGPSHSHGLPGSLHLGREDIGSQGKLVKGKSRHLCHYVVQCRFKACRRVSQRNLVQIHTHSNLGRYPGNRVPGGFRRQGRRPGDPGIDFYDIVIKRFRIQGELDITASLNLKCPDDLQGTVSQHVVFFVGQCLAGCHNDRIPGMYAYRVQIFHIADGDGCVVGIPHYFIFYLLESFDAFFYKDLAHRGEGKSSFHFYLHLSLVCGKSASRSPKSERRSEYDRITDPFCCRKSLFQRISNDGRDYWFSQLFTEFFELFSVLCPPDTLHVSSQKLNLTFIKDAFFVEGERKVQACLTADTRKDGIRSFVAADSCHILEGQRLHINLVCYSVICHDRSRIGISKDYFIAFFLQGKAGLGSCVIKFCCLSDHDGTRSDDKHFFDISSFRHLLSSPSFS